MRFLCYMILAAALFSASCASIEYANAGQQVNDNNKLSDREVSDLGLKISAEENVQLGSDYFGVINFSFINTSQEWIYIKNIKLDFGDGINENIRIISGKDIYAWKESTLHRNQIDEYNMKLFLGTVALAGAFMSESGNKYAGKTGELMLLGAYSSLSVKELNDSQKKINYPAIFPQNHLLSGEIIVPPGLFVKKWIVVNSRNHDKIGIIKKFDIEYETKSNDKERIRIRLENREMLKGLSDNPVWQKDIFLRD